MSKPDPGWLDSDTRALAAALESERAARRLYDEARAELAAARRAIEQSHDAGRLVALEAVARLARECREAQRAAIGHTGIYFCGKAPEPARRASEASHALDKALAALDAPKAVEGAPEAKDAPQGSTRAGIGI